MQPTIRGRTRGNPNTELRRLVKDIKHASADPSYHQQPAQECVLSGRIVDNQAVVVQANVRAVNALQTLHSDHVLKQLQARGTDISSTAAGKIKQYPTVTKGPVTLPGGPQWQALRRHLRYQESPNLPFVKALLVVEGRNDHAAVARAANVPVYVCGGSRVLREYAWQELQVLPYLGLDVVVLTDPDAAGRAFRRQVDDLIGPLHHAFLPEAAATALTATGFKEAGNIGVEHASPLAIRAALDNVVYSFGPDRKVFSREQLIKLNLMNGLQKQVTRNVGLRRRLVCALLGVGDCDGSQLVAVLNRWFTVEQFMDAVQMADDILGAHVAAAGFCDGTVA